MADQAMVRRLLAGGGDDKAAFLSAYQPRTAWTSVVGQTDNALGGEPTALLADRIPGHSQASGDGAATLAIRRGEDDQGTLNRPLGTGRPTDPGLQLLPLLNREHEGSGMHGDAPRDRR